MWLFLTHEPVAALADRDKYSLGHGFCTPLDRAARCIERPPSAPSDTGGAALAGTRLLLAAGAEATAKDEVGSTALHYAAAEGPDDPALAGVLMGAGCDPAARGQDGQTALELAKEKNKPRMAALLQAATEAPEATLAPFRAEAAALVRLVSERGLEAGLAALKSAEERLAAVRQLEPGYDEMLAQEHRRQLAAIADLADLHSAVKFADLEGLAAGLLAKHAAGQLEAGASFSRPQYAS